MKQFKSNYACCLLARDKGFRWSEEFRYSRRENRATTRDETILLNVVISIGMSHEGRMRITSTFLFTLHRTQPFCNTISIAELQTRLLNERWGCIISRMIIPRLKRMCFLCVALRARSNIVLQSKSYALEKNLLRIFIFSRGGLSYLLD